MAGAAEPGPGQERANPGDPPTTTRRPTPPSPLLLRGIEIGDDAGPWERAGFTVGVAGTPGSPSGGAVRVGTVRFSLTGAGRDPGRGIRRWAFVPADGSGRSVPSGELDGLALAPVPAGDDQYDDDPAGDSGHPNGAVRLDHLVVLSPDVDRTTTAFATAGLDARRVRPVPGSRPPRVQVFFRAGEVIIELVGPDRSADPTGADRRAEGPARFFGLAFTVTDLDATAALLGEHLSEIRPAVQPGRRIATLRHRALDLSVPVAFLSQTFADGARGSEASRA